MSSARPQPTHVDQLIERYSVLLLDAYGVLMAHDGALAGAARLIQRLEARAKPFFVVTNDASRSAASWAERFREVGLPIAAERVITAGMLLRSHFARRRLRGARCLVLGPEDSAGYVREAGGQVLGLAEADALEVLVLADEHGYPLLETLDAALSAICRRIDAGQAVHLVLPNPDLVYPAGAGRLGFTAGSLARMFEHALRGRYPGRTDVLFVPLGKPHRAIFEEALRRSGTRDMVMVGDQLDTDILGAARFGIDSALLRAGPAPRDDAALAGEARPTYLLGSLAMA
jgi:HAD superfamily hydrolase (TIGR01450 family)